MKKKIEFLFSTIAMVLLIFVILITSFQMAIYGDTEYNFYKKQYEKYEVTKDLDMKIEDVMTVTRYMMDYLIGREETLSIETTVEGKSQDFFNEQDRLHMKDVQDLFLGGLFLRNIALILLIGMIAALILFKADLKYMLPRAFLLAFGVIGGLTVIIGILFATDFTKYFTIFHEMFFTNDLWVFDPETDYMIRMLPEGFFYGILGRIGRFFGFSLGLPLIISIVMIRMNNKTYKTY
ncbi:integral membrane protein (TIGR01906 family) [Aequitasia blattaphilus]|uniref:TIGR01906 family membrane protein n=1 Tax=Aequitasia blattaphilus TaxID=2949332 RepID=A0ABT1E6L3_9FIRM|nr:TIGR01906 family membrane protein [Aequitasia blattaphilus]MCP1101229.1 TIGR01906 family membrane protein [Aequitasia blattaphilus]MCR8613869.1 TIGR01906 family membrane protein [Aequitasia blattaphilus]